MFRGCSPKARRRQRLARLFDNAEREAGRAIALFEQSGDRVGLAHSWRVIAHVDNRRLQWAELERVGERIDFALGRAGAGDRQRAVEVRDRGVVRQALAAVAGPGPHGGEMREIAPLGKRFANVASFLPSLFAYSLAP